MSPFSANSSSAMCLQTNTTAELLQPPHSTLAPPFHRSLNVLFSTFPFPQSQMTAPCQFTPSPMPRPTHVCSRSATNCQWISNRRRDAHALLYHWHSVEFPSTALTCTCQPTRCPKKTGHYHRVRRITAIAPNATNLGLAPPISNRHPNQVTTTQQHLTFLRHRETDASVTGVRLHDLA